MKAEILDHRAKYLAMLKERAAEAAARRKATVAAATHSRKIPPCRCSRVGRLNELDADHADQLLHRISTLVAERRALPASA